MPPDDHFIPALNLSLEDLYEMTEEQRLAFYSAVIRELSEGEIAGLEGRIADDMIAVRMELAALQDELHGIIATWDAGAIADAENQLKRIAELFNLIENLPIELCKSRGRRQSHDIRVTDGGDYTLSAGDDVVPGEEFAITYSGEAVPPHPPTVTIALHPDDKVTVAAFEAATGEVRFRVVTRRGAVYHVAVRSQPGSQPLIVFTAPSALPRDHFRAQHPKLLMRLHTDFAAAESLARQFGLETRQSVENFFPPQLHFEDHPYATALIEPQAIDFKLERRCEISCGRRAGVFKLKLDESDRVTFAKASGGALALTVENTDGRVTLLLREFDFGQHGPETARHALEISGGVLAPDSWRALTPFAALIGDHEWRFLASRVTHGETNLYETARDAGYDWIAELALIDPACLY